MLGRKKRSGVRSLYRPSIGTLRFLPVGDGPVKCMTPGCWEPRVKGRARCSKHGPRTPKMPGDPRFTAAHRKRRQDRIDAGETCAMAHLGGCHGPLHLDHIRPLSMGGQAGSENEQLLCERHNIRKGGSNRLKPAG